MAACLGYGNRNHGDQATADEQTVESFFHQRNYRQIIECLDGGYEISTDILEYMEDYLKLQQKWSSSCNSYSKKWEARLHSRSVLSSYNTTKRAQLDTVNFPAKRAPLELTRCKAIEQVIIEYRRKVDSMYPKTVTGLFRKHYQSAWMEKSFSDAYADVRKAYKNLDKFRKEQTTAEEALRQLKSKHQNLPQDAKAEDGYKKKQEEVQEIKGKIALAKENLHEKEKSYREKAAKIYRKCREFEKERLDDIRKVLLEFNQAAHSVDYSAEHNTIHQQLLETIKIEQNTLADLNFWAATYGVEKSVLLDTRSTTAENTEASETDDSE